MNRKNTILLAVLINAGLLVVLFVTALTSPSELSMPPTHEMSLATTKQDLHTPLFGDELDLAMRQPLIPVADELPLVLPEPTPISSVAVHKLPAPVVEAPPMVAIVSTPSQAPSPVAVAADIHEVIVKKGDTLEKIARANKTTVDEIIKINHLPSSFLRVGQALRLPAERTAQARVAGGPTAEKASPTPDYYTVKVGDNPWTIAMKNQIKVDELLKLNALNDEKARKLKAGDRLRIR